MLKYTRKSSQQRLEKLVEYNALKLQTQMNLTQYLPYYMTK